LSKASSICPYFIIFTIEYLYIMAFSSISGTIHFLDK
jgi:hypothetical protein